MLSMCDRPVGQLLGCSRRDADPPGAARHTPQVGCHTMSHVLHRFKKELGLSCPCSDCVSGLLGCRSESPRLFPHPIPSAHEGVLWLIPLWVTKSSSGTLPRQTVFFSQTSTILFSSRSGPSLRFHRTRSGVASPRLNRSPRRIRSSSTRAAGSYSSGMTVTRARSGSARGRGAITRSMLWNPLSTI